MFDIEVTIYYSDGHPKWRQSFTPAEFLDYVSMNNPYERLAYGHIDRVDVSRVAHVN